MGKNHQPKPEPKPPLLEEHIYRKSKTSWLQIQRITSYGVQYLEITNTTIKQPRVENLTEADFLLMVKAMQFCEKCTQPAKTAVVRPPNLTQLVCKDHSPIRFQ